MICCHLENKENNKRLNSKNVHRPFGYSADLGKLETNSIKTQNGRKYDFSTCTSAQPWEGGWQGWGEKKKKYDAALILLKSSSLFDVSIHIRRTAPPVLQTLFFVVVVFPGLPGLEDDFLPPPSEGVAG